MSLHNDESGVSVIIGTLMMILITITAASGLALMVSWMQKDAIERESHLAAVASENIRIIAIDPVGDDTHWDSVNVTIMNLNTADSRITAISLNGVHARNYRAKDASGDLDYYRDGYPVIYNFNKRVVIPAAGSKEICLNFTGIVINTSENVTFLKWNDNKSESFSLPNHPRVAYPYALYPTMDCSENVSNSTFTANIGDYTMDHKTGNITLLGNGSMTNTSSYDITYETTFDAFPQSFSVCKNEPLTVEVITSLINIFKRTFMPPVPLAEVQVKSECVNASSNKFRDILILDASESFDPGDGFITEYRWTVWVTEDYGNRTNLTGMKVRPVGLNLSESHEIDLEVRDDTGMVSRLSQRSGNITIP
jgi:archaellin